MNNKSRSGMSSIPGHGSSNYLIVRPHQGGFLDLLRYVLTGDAASKAKFLEQPESFPAGATAFLEQPESFPAGTTAFMMQKTQDVDFVFAVKLVVLKILYLLQIPMKYTGCLVDYILNLLSLNGGFFGLLFRFIIAKVEKPKEGSENYLSTIGQLDGRIDLYKGSDFVECIDLVKAGSTGRDWIEPGSRGLMDLCMMASKLVYENANVVRRVVHDNWKMHLVEVVDCWNDYQKRSCKQVFILTDKDKDANLILISFRGTEPFDALDWATDFDFSWYPVAVGPDVGELHIGFLEAMGLGNRDEPFSFGYHLSKKASFLEENLPDMAQGSAYHKLVKHLKSLLSKHENAQVVVTGHSLGGALAILFPTVLVLKEEKEIMERLLGVYTFGQPRIADRVMGDYMKAHLSDRYFRVVYSNDIVPRLPFDDKTFRFRHFGPCLYYNSFYQETRAEDEPEPNTGLRYLMFGHITAVWELVRGLTMGYTHGPAYKEGWFRVLFRLMGILLPGLSDHCSTDYVNSVRLGPENSLQQSRLGSVLCL